MSHDPRRGIISPPLTMVVRIDDWTCQCYPRGGDTHGEANARITERCCSGMSHDNLQEEADRPFSIRAKPTLVSQMAFGNPGSPIDYCHQKKGGRRARIRSLRPPIT